jgi:hypothetical protein
MYGVPTGVDANGLPIPYTQLLGEDHVVEIFCQIEDSFGAVLSWQFGVEGGDVTVDRTAAVRRSCKIEVTPFGAAGVIADATVLEQLAETLIPDDASGVFAPYGNQVRLWYGIEVPGYTNVALGNNFYTWQLGVFRLSSVDISDDGVPRMTVSGFDHSRTISRRKNTIPWLVAAGTNYGDAIIAFCVDRLPTLTFKPHTVTAVTPQIIVDAESDPWKTVTDWAAAIGSEVFIDRDGEGVIQDEPDPLTDPVVWTYDDGSSNANAILLSTNTGMSDDPGYNGVVLTSESNTLDAPIRVEVWDDDPDSPTFALGPYGKVPYFTTNPLVTDYTQGGIVGNSELLKILGLTESTDFAVIPNPAHEAGDVVRVIRPMSRVDATAVLDSFTIPLAVTDAMPIRTRERRSSAQISGGLV